MNNGALRGIFNILLVFAAVLTAAVLIWPLVTYGNFLSETRSQNRTLLELSEKVDRAQKSSEQSMAVVSDLQRELQEAVSMGVDISAIELQRGLSDLNARLSSLERSLDLDPGKAIDLALLEQRVNAAEDDVMTIESAVQSDIDRLYELYANTVIGIFVALVLLIFGNIFNWGVRK